MKLAIPALVLLIALGVYFATRHPLRVSETKISTNRQETTASSNVLTQLKPTTNHVQPAKIASETNTNSVVEQQIIALAEASTKSDSNSFQFIVNALKDPQAEVRQAALDAAIQFGSRDAIPFLKEAAARTEDPREKVKILDAIEFLELPTFSEIKQTRRTNSNPSRIPGAPK